MIIAIDPSKKTPAVAIFDKGKFKKAFKLSRSKKGYYDSLYDLMNYAKEHDAQIIIEDQYKGINFNSITSLIECRAEIQAIAALVGVPIEIIHPKTWQTKALHIRGKRMCRNDLKKLSKIRASELIGKEIKDHDLADAINMADVWLNVLRFNDN